MAKQIPPKSFFRLNQDQQYDFAIREMQKAYEIGDQWKQLSIQAKKKHVTDPDPRPDEIAMKDA